MEDGRAVWSTKEEDLHLYSDAKGSWCLSDKYTPGESNSMAHFEGNPPVRWGVRWGVPQHKYQWTLGKSMLALRGDMLCGDAGPAWAVRGLAQHTCLSACCCDVLRSRCSR